ncbi:hypothetical protein JTB14_007162 [Gonioctena quinquepunctata]|nr:hypothetical protein JTB14_007162 [Gonioctena quinquepunctata]
MAYEVKSDAEIVPSPKRKRKDSPDNVKNKITKGKESWIEDSLKLSSNKTLTASIARAKAAELAENSEQLCNCGQPANQDHFLVDAENMKIHIKCQGSIELTEKIYGSKLTTLSKYIQGHININEEIETPFPDYRSAYMDVTSAPEQENLKNSSQKSEPKRLLSENEIFLISESNRIEKQIEERKTAANERKKKAENTRIKAKALAENISKADLKDAGPSKPNVVNAVKEKGNMKNPPETDYESESSSSYKQKKKKRNTRKSLDAKVGTEQYYHSNERRRTSIEDEIKNQAKAKTAVIYKKLQQAYATIKDVDLPLQPIMAASSGAVYEHWKRKLTEQRQSELDACKKADDNRSHKKTNQHMEVTSETKEHLENWPKLPQEKQEYELPKRSKRKAVNRDTINDPTEISNPYSPLSNLESSNNEDENNTEYEDNPQLRGRQRGSKKQTKQISQPNQSNKSRKMPPIIVSSLLAVDKAPPRQQPIKYIDAPPPEKNAWQQKKGPERELPRGLEQEPAQEHSSYGRQESHQGQRSATRMVGYLPPPLTSQSYNQAESITRENNTNHNNNSIGELFERVDTIGKLVDIPSIIRAYDNLIAHLRDAPENRRQGMATAYFLRMSF